VLVIIPKSTKITPKVAICRATAPCPTSTNCGRNDQKKSAVLGLSTATSNPCENTRPDARACPDTGSTDRAASQVRTPSTTRYTAPARRTTLKANGQAASTAARPTVASSTCVKSPAAAASTEISPALRPWDRLRATV